jgi:DNA-binding MarR family transcriptional regulator
VHRNPSPHNRREICLTLTDAGKSLLRRFDDRRVLHMRDCLARIAPDRQDDVVAALSEFAAGARPA